MARQQQHGVEFVFSVSKVAGGKSASSISVILGLSENTINFYVKNAMRKLGTTNRVVAVVLAVRAGIIQP